MNDEIPENINKLIEKIRLDNTSGSVELAKKSAELLILLADKNPSLSQINNALYSLVKAQPTMASIFNLVNNLKLDLDKNKNQLLKNIINNNCKKFLKNLDTSDETISKQVLKLIKNNAIIITHSYSCTVKNSLIYAKKSGKRFSVICTESRPKNEGVILAKQLGENKIKVKLLVDSALFSFIPYADMLLFGGDAVTYNGIINKIGTKGIAITANHYDKPTYALCSSIKFLPKNYPVTLDQLKKSDEIIKGNISNVTPINFYFDYTPLELLTGIIMEKKIMKPLEIKERINKLKIHNNYI
jgi:translation initiation factor 2B subunit (eIF-2B alpha/beta/delta family)